MYFKLTKQSKLVLRITLFILASVIFSLFWFILDSNKNFKSIADTDIETLMLSSQITKIDEILSKTAILSAESNDTTWEKQYIEKEIILNDIILKIYNKNPDILEKIANSKPKAYKEKLYEIEQNVFEAVKNGNQELAKKLIYSKSYTEQKQLFEKEMEKIINEIIENSSKKINKQNNLSKIIISISVLGIIALIIMYVAMSRVIKIQDKVNLRLKNQNKELNIAKKKAEESESYLRKLNVTRDKLFSIITHDLNNPLSSIMGFSNIMKQFIKEKNYEKVEEAANYISICSKKTIDLRENLMQWSLSQDNKMTFKPEKLDLRLIIEKVEKLLHFSALQKNITIKKNIDDIAIYADAKSVQTILRNLISNSIKYTEKDGEIIISAKKKNKKCLITIEDTGIGIKKELIPNLFELNNSKSTKGTADEVGTGLGLYLCKEFIERNGGKIWVESEIGKGSCFAFILPLASSKSFSENDKAS